MTVHCRSSQNSQPLLCARESQRCTLSSLVLEDGHCRLSAPLLVRQPSGLKVRALGAPWLCNFTTSSVVAREPSRAVPWSHGVRNPFKQTEQEGQKEAGDVARCKKRNYRRWCESMLALKSGKPLNRCLTGNFRHCAHMRRDTSSDHRGLGLCAPGSGPLR